jgi:lipoprotein-releasing system ATP-binding protein
METTIPRVLATDLAHAFPGTGPLFEQLSFELQAGEVTGLCGPSGCGKSTLLSILAGWQRPSAGRLRLEAISRTGWVFQNPHGVARRTALDHVTFPLLTRGRSRREAEAEARETMRLFRLTDVADRPFSALSGGEAQRLMLARSVCSAPDLLLVDEPTAQLDRATAATVNETLGNIAASGAVVVIATHDAQTKEACSRVIEMLDHAPTTLARATDGAGA